MLLCPSTIIVTKVWIFLHQSNRNTGKCMLRINVPDKMISLHNLARKQSLEKLMLLFKFNSIE